MVIDVIVISVVIDLETISKLAAHASSSKSFTTLLLMLHQISIVIVPWSAQLITVAQSRMAAIENTHKLKNMQNK